MHPSKPIRDKYPNCINYHKLDKLVFIAEAKNMIQINSGVSNVYTFSNAYFEGVGFYAARPYVNFKNEEERRDYL